jgi:hypothetical protein
MFFINKIKAFFCLADYISNIFEILRHELKNNEFKNIFLSYFGTWTIMKWCKLANKVCLYIINIIMIRNLIKTKKKASIR